uniref:COP9 signalosome complex subunit 4 n=1 Tax=Phaeomonas parva TaxID=124430 RepID=A0A7S1U060_9STRA
MDLATVVTALAQGRNAFAALVERIVLLPPEQLLAAGQIALSALSARNPTPSTHGAAEFKLRSKLFDVLLAQEEFFEAASTMAAMHMESVQLPPEQAADAYIKVAETYLELDEAVDAEVFANKASPLMADVSDRSLELRYRTTYARVLDANRKFLDAATRYYDVSKVSEGVDPDDLLLLLGRAVTCACLGRAGPQRTRILAQIFRDERLQSLETLEDYRDHAAVLAKMYKGQLIRRHELEGFTASLLDHQKAICEGGFTYPERAIMEHNIEACGKIYECIALGEFATILGVTGSVAEGIAAKMISQGRLSAVIDQVDGFLTFEASRAGVGGAAAKSPGVFTQWDEKLTNVCRLVNTIVEDVAGRID